ncbi:GAF domain-containing protein [Deinococcus radiophilus]|uniref:GAF domain-containing protein n=1 Tax=Deinococcus radiophilus TaxID=32062 RepID=UPI003606A064
MLTPSPAATEPGQLNRGHLSEIWSTGFVGSGPQHMGVGPVSYAALMERGEVITYRATHDEGTPLGRGLSDLAPQVALIAPLRVRGQPLGVLYADSDRPEALRNGDAALLLELAEQAGLALGSAHRFAEATRQQRSESVLRELGQAFQANCTWPIRWPNCSSAAQRYWVRMPPRCIPLTQAGEPSVFTRR